jgi:cyclin-dependent kinase regulatory subunit CKS1
MPHYPEEIEYSEKYYDDFYEYRHVTLPKAVFKQLPTRELLTEAQWRALGVQ